MHELPRDASAKRARSIVDLARRDRLEAARVLAALSPEAKLAVVCDAPVAERAPLLALLDDPAEVVPRMPAAELCYTAKAVGLADAGWILEHASESQLVACVDLDAWSTWLPDSQKLGAWLLALLDAGEETVLRGLRALDFEQLMLWLRDRAEVHLKPSASESESWTPPPGSHSLEGQFHLVARRDEDDLADVIQILRLLFERDYWVYYRLMQAVIWEIDSDAEEWALRWRRGRLQDLGFPDWEESKAIYAWLRPEQLHRLPDPGHVPSLGEWPLPIWFPQLAGAGRAGRRRTPALPLRLPGPRKPRRHRRRTRPG